MKQEATQSTQKWTLAQVAYTFLRYSVAFWFLFYGFAKLCGAQFTILDSELDKPMGQVSGFWLTWYYFGYSPLFGGVVALAQIGGAILLMFRRTTLIAACALVPVVVNILLIDICFAIDFGATLIALYLLGALLCILLMHRVELMEVFWKKQNALYRPVPMPRLAAAGVWTLRTAMVAGLCYFGYIIANFNNRLPTPIDGAWQVTSVKPANHPETVPAMIFFEYNRAWWCTFKMADGRYETHHFEVDCQNRSVGIWRDWMAKGPQVFSGRYDLSGSGLTLTGAFAGINDTYTIHLTRKNPRATHD
jgi:hypothetical protein